MIKNLIKKAIKTLNISDTDNIQKAQVSYFGKTKNVEVVSPYGLYSVSPVNSQAILFQVNGQEENTVGFFDDVNNRPKNLKEGEVLIKNTVTGDSFYLKSDGTIELTSATINATGDLSITGDLSVSGDLTVTGDVSGGTVTAGNGATGTFTNSVTVVNGIVTAGS